MVPYLMFSFESVPQLSNIDLKVKRSLSFAFSYILPITKQKKENGRSTSAIAMENMDTKVDKRKSIKRTYVLWYATRHLLG